MPSCIEVKDVVNVADRGVIGLLLDGRPACLACQVGVFFDDDPDGQEFIRKVEGSWRDDFARGETHDVLRGEPLKTLRQLLSAQGEAALIPARARSVMVLFAPGVHLALSRTTSPLAIVLRRKLSDRLMPDLPPQVASGLTAPVTNGDEVDVMIHRLQQVVAFSGLLKEEDFDYVVRRVLSSTARRDDPRIPQLYSEKYS